MNLLSVEIDKDIFYKKKLQTLLLYSNYIGLSLRDIRRKYLEMLSLSPKEDLFICLYEKEISDLKEVYYIPSIVFYVGEGKLSRFCESYKEIAEYMYSKMNETWKPIYDAMKTYRECIWRGFRNQVECMEIKDIHVVEPHDIKIEIEPTKYFEIMANEGDPSMDWCAGPSCRIFIDRGEEFFVVSFDIYCFVEDRGRKMFIAFPEVNVERLYRSPDESEGILLAFSGSLMSRVSANDDKIVVTLSFGVDEGEFIKDITNFGISVEKLAEIISEGVVFTFEHLPASEILAPMIMFARDVGIWHDIEMFLRTINSVGESLVLTENP